MQSISIKKWHDKPRWSLILGSFLAKFLAFKLLSPIRTTTSTTTTTPQGVPVGSTYTYTMTVDGSAGGLKVTVKFEKVSTVDINMTSILTCPADELFNDMTRCGDH